MNANTEFIFEANVPANDASFLQRIFTQVAKSKKHLIRRERDPLRRAILEEFNDLSRRADRSGIQNSCSIRNVFRTRELAKCLIGDDGNVASDRVAEALPLLKENLYELGPGRQHDGERQRHILRCLERLLTDSELVAQIKTIQKPHAHQGAEKVIRQTLHLSEKDRVTDVDARRAALAAWLCTLRQSIGSCFATAPAIIVHDEQTSQFFADIRELFATGRIKRTFGGVEYSVPLSPSWGGGDLRRLIVLGGKEPQNEVWLSAGLMAAFETMELVDAKKSLAKRIAELKELIDAFVAKRGGKDRPIPTTAYEVIRFFLMDKLDLTEDVLADHENSLRGMAASGGLMGFSSSSGGKASQCKKFHSLEESACDAFKSIADNALLKTWEFTIASFAETKPTFTRWNLYASLGFQHESPGGIGECLYEELKVKLEEKNERVSELNEQCEQMYPHIRYLETRLRTAPAEEVRWLKSDFMSKTSEFRMLEEMRAKAQLEAQWFANLYNVFLNYYDKLFPVYFQEIYDADMHGMGGGRFDDSPAGFRLVYKYGRSNTSQWSRINTPAEYIDALTNFFNATEHDLRGYPEFEGRDQELTELVTALVRHVRTPRFLETSFDRMSDAYRVPRVKNPLENLDKIEKKPWVYKSGGNLESLVKSYWRREEDLTEDSRWVENPTELFVFIVDSLKKQPAKTMQLYEKDSLKSMLTHSPTHAYLLKPGRKIVRQAWESNDFTYTWIRDRVIAPREQFYERMELGREEMEYLIDAIAERFSAEKRHFFRKSFSNMWGSLSPTGLGREIAKKIRQEIPADVQEQEAMLAEVGRVFYEELPLFEVKDLVHRLFNIVTGLPGLQKVSKDEIAAIADGFRKTMIGVRLLGASTLIDLAAATCLLLLGKLSHSVNYHQLILDRAREYAYAAPEPVFYADSNWVGEQFAFVVNPANGILELWRVDPTGFKGISMFQWNQWLNGTRRDRKWGVYTHPYQYVPSQESPFGL